MTLYIIRHGETEFNKLGIVQGSGVDTDLNDTGLAQANAFYQAYQEVDFELIVTSKLKRTHQTARPFIQKDIPWLQNADINEICWGDHEGRPSTPESIQMYRHMIEEWRNGNLDASLPNGETARQLSERVGRFLDWIKTRPEKRILVCSHGRTMRCIVTMMKGFGPAGMEGMKHANTGCYVVRWHNGAFEFELENDTRHLEASGLEVRVF
jgi:broad specificity phosphatase PhoE